MPLLQQLGTFIGVMLIIIWLLTIVSRVSMLKRKDHLVTTFVLIKTIAIIFLVLGVLYWFTQKVQPINTMSGSITVYVTLVVSLILLFQAASKLRWKPFVKKSVVDKTRNLLAVIIILSGFLYWHISIIDLGLSKFDAWLLGLDIILAHMTITIPMFQWFYFTIKKMLQRFLGVASIISALVSFWLVWLFLIKTTNLQIALFGSYNSTLGWDLPTSYKFSILFEQLQNLFGNQVLATIVGFVVFATSITLSYTSILSSIITIEEGSK